MCPLYSKAILSRPSLSSFARHNMVTALASGSRAVGKGTCLENRLRASALWATDSVASLRVLPVTVFDDPQGVCAAAADSITRRR